MDALLKGRIRVPGAEVRVIERCGSTSALLGEMRGEIRGEARHDERAAQPVLLAAELQTAGRGRHGRPWRSARGAGATFSIRRAMRCGQSKLAGLSVALGVCTARALRALGARGVTLKWPNDLMAKRGKLGGILVETRSSSPGACVVIVGIGINCRRQPRLAARLGRRVAALDEVARRPLSRNAVIGAVARAVLGALAAWERSAWTDREEKAAA
jgi:BirA family biotin operon repressor/biotin-[acetyl-CoA-carboxylase] ligase